MFWLIGKSPEKQAKLYEEISSNIGSSPVTAANLGYLPYLKACVKESFRFRTITLIVHLIVILNEVKYTVQMNEIKKNISHRCVPPVASGTARVLQLDTEIGGYLIPKGVGSIQLENYREIIFIRGCNFLWILGIFAHS